MHVFFFLHFFWVAMFNICTSCLPFFKFCLCLYLFICVCALYELNFGIAYHKLFEITLDGRKRKNVCTVMFLTNVNSHCGCGILYHYVP